MKTCWQITFPQHPGQAFPIAASNGQTLPTRARSDTRPKKGYPVRILTRAEWDDQNKPAGPYLAAYQPKRPVPDVDFEAEDGSLWPTAEACLEHELEKRFGVKTLAEVEAQMKASLTVGDVADALTVKLERRHFHEGEKVCIGSSPEIYTVTVGGLGVITVKHVNGGLTGPMEIDGAVCRLAEPALYDKNGNPPFSGVPEGDPSDASPDEAARLLASALSRRGLKVAEAAQATGLTPAQVKATAASLPGQFAMKGGRVFLVG